MMRKLPAFVLVLVIIPAFARAETLVVIRPGIMCRSPDALARLTLHGGDSRTHRDPVRPKDLAIASDGGCRDLAPGEPLTVLQAFRNTARVVSDDRPGEVFTAPLIDLGPAPDAGAAQAEQADPGEELGDNSQGNNPQGDNFQGDDPQGDDPVSESSLNRLIGRTEENFVSAHPGGHCVDSGPHDASCVYDAGSYNSGDQSSCPFEFACTITMYGFHDGRLTSYQSGLQFEYEWKRAYRLARRDYGTPTIQRAGNGESSFFRTAHGVLGLGRTFGGPKQKPTWAIRYYLTNPASDTGQ